MRKKALITGITGQDGKHLADLLLDKDYEVYGMVTGHRETGRNDLGITLPKVKKVHGDLAHMKRFDGELSPLGPTLPNDELVARQVFGQAQGGLKFVLVVRLHTKGSWRLGSAYNKPAPK